MAMHSFFIGIIYQRSMQLRTMPSARIVRMRVPSNMNCFDKVATLAETIIPCASTAAHVHSACCPAPNSCCRNGNINSPWYDRANSGNGLCLFGVLASFRQYNQIVQMRSDDSISLKCAIFGRAQPSEIHFRREIDDKKIARSYAVNFASHAHNRSDKRYEYVLWTIAA